MRRWARVGVQSGGTRSMAPHSAQHMRKGGGGVGRAGGAFKIKDAFLSQTKARISARMLPYNLMYETKIKIRNAE